ncbi:hypothetical protein COBT_000662 [Conglomerata obtusa]
MLHRFLCSSFSDSSSKQTTSSLEKNSTTYKPNSSINNNEINPTNMLRTEDKSGKTIFDIKYKNGNNGVIYVNNNMYRNKSEHYEKTETEEFVDLITRLTVLFIECKVNALQKEPDINYEQLRTVKSSKKKEKKNKSLIKKQQIGEYVDMIVNCFDNRGYSLNYINYTKKMIIEKVVRKLKINTKSANEHQPNYDSDQNSDSGQQSKSTKVQSGQSNRKHSFYAIDSSSDEN